MLRFSSFPPQMLQTGLNRGKWSVCGSLPASPLQGSRQDFHSPADPHSPPHHSAGNRKRNFARTNARPAALRFGGEPGSRTLQERVAAAPASGAVGRPNPGTAPPRYPLAHLPSSPFLPSGSSSVLSSSWPSGDLFFGGGNGNPLQYSCLETPMDRGAWRATVRGVAKSRTRLSPEHARTPFFSRPPKTAASFSPL